MNQIVSFLIQNLYAIAKNVPLFFLDIRGNDYESRQQGLIFPLRFGACAEFLITGPKRY